MVNAGIGEPRGILNRTAGERKFRLSLHPPARDLAYFVEHYWIVTWDLRSQAPYQQDVLTHPCVHLVIERGKSRVVGVVTGKFSQLLEGKGQVFGIKFKPGAFYPFVNVPVARFTDTAIPLADVFAIDSTALERTVLSGTDDKAMIAHIDRFLRAWLP